MASKKLINNNNNVIKNKMSVNHQINLIKDHLLMMSRSRVWVSDVSSGFLPGEISDLSSSDQVTVTVTTVNNKQIELNVAYENVFPAEDNSNLDYEDNCSLMYLNEATLLNNVAQRFKKGNIYSYIANMLIAVNPYITIQGLYDDSAIKRYQGKSLGTLPPHVYAIGDKSFRDMKVTKQSQSIIVSGESGAGKTESTKYILRYLCGSWGSSAGPIEQRILDANPILESFGNAKTTRNNNSSRFGKFIEIHFEQQQKVAGGFISHYLLEKSRIIGQSREERNYHIFYELLQGLPENEKIPLGLNGKTPSDFNYLKNGCCEFFGETLRDPIVHDKKDFEILQKSFKNLDIKETAEIYKIVACVLHLGNIQFNDDPELTSKGGCKVVESNSLDLVSKLMELDRSEFISALTNRVMQTAKGGVKGTVIMVPLKPYEASAARDALSKSIYNRLFDYIVKRINDSIPFDSTVHSTYIGVLDIAGFEYFTVNSFEQFCINYCNEKLQQFFNERVLRDEQNLYEKEGLNIAKIDFIDNLDCIELIEGKIGIMSLLDEESKLPKPLATHFTCEVQRILNNHFRLELPRKSKIKEHREIRDDEGFIIRHFAGAVCYETKHFIEKNNDALHFSLEVLVQECGNKFLKKLYTNIEGYKGKLAFVSVAGKFKMQLTELLEKLRGTGTSFIRCIKPNSKMVPNVFEGGLILSQLQCAGMTSVLELMQRGYPSRVQFNVLYETYKSLLPPKLVRLDPRFFCRALFKALGLSEEDFRFGLTKVFFRPGKFKEFDQIMKTDPESLLKLVEAVGKWIIQSKWKMFIYGVVSSIKLKNKIKYRHDNLIIIQKSVKMYLARKQHRPRYLAIMKLNKLKSQVKQLEQSANKLNKKDVNKECLKMVNKLDEQINQGICDIKSNPKMEEKKIEQVTMEMLNATDNLMKIISAKIEFEKNAEEQEKARKLREELEKQKNEKIQAEKIKALEEEHKKQKQEMELRRKEEEEKHEKLEKLSEKNKLNSENIKIDKNLVEQEKRDNEMAYRLATESNVTLDESIATPTGLKRSNFVVNSKAGKKHDLSGWKYSELRDTINTSCDVLLLEACREEFHRRLKVYHAWKARNSSQKSVVGTTTTTGNNNDNKEESERAPKSVYQYQKSYINNTPTANIPSTQKRYFRIPFTKDGQNKGLWFAHFEGEYIHRQMEIHIGKEPTLLVAGRDDMQMCELKLSETGLTRKRGAEILEYDFEKEWNKHSK